MVVEKGNLEFVKTLLSYNPQLDHFDSTGNTALMIAVRKGRRDIVEALLSAGANVNAAGIIDNPLLPRVTGITALHVAALNGDIPLMELLLSRGADLHAIKTQIRNPTASNASVGRFFKSYNHTSQETVVDLAQRKGFREAESFLRERGADSANAHRQNSCCTIM